MKLKSPSEYERRQGKWVHLVAYNVTFWVASEGWSDGRVSGDWALVFLERAFFGGEKGERDGRAGGGVESSRL